MKIKKLSGKRANIGDQGFSLVELLVVVAILGILSIAVGVNINSAKTKLKTFVFNTKTRFNQARFEAIKSSRDVYLEFHLKMNEAGYLSTALPDNGYTIWMDNDGDTVYDSWNVGSNDTNGNGECDTDEGDCIISVMDFDQLSGGRDGPEIYNGTEVYPTGGPKDPNGGPKGYTIGTGVSVGGNRFKFKPNGDSGAGGTVYFYFPQGPPTAKEVKAGPFAIIVNSVGRIRAVEWKSVVLGWESD